MKSNHKRGLRQCQTALPARPGEASVAPVSMAGHRMATGSDLKMALVVRSDMNMVRHATALPVIRPVCTHEAGRSSLICMKRKLHALLWLRF